MSLIQSSDELLRRVTGLRVVRAFSDRAVDPHDLNAILEAARWTGSSKNRQGWAFIVIEGRDELERLASAGEFTDPVRNSVLTIALVQTPDGNPFDIGRAAQNVMLAAASRGIGSCPITLHHEERAAEILGLPDGHVCRYAVALGYPDDEGERREREARRSSGMRGRRPIDALVHRGRYGA